jgi:hypothetical protein
MPPDPVASACRQLPTTVALIRGRNHGEQGRNACATRRGSLPTPHRVVVLAKDRRVRATLCTTTFQQEIIMGKYVIGWFLGVPLFVLVIAYFFFH